MSGAVFLEGERLTLRLVQADDYEFLTRLWNETSVRYQAGAYGPFSGEDLAGWVAADDDADFLVCRDETPVGHAMVRKVDWESRNADLAYGIHPDEEGNGYATEAAGLCLTHAFDGMGLHKVTAMVLEGNEASMRVLEKLGFEKEGVFREQINSFGDYVDTHHFGLLRSEWQ